jgi:predicted acylesterase/phospholipase RssA
MRKGLVAMCAVAVSGCTLEAATRGISGHQVLEAFNGANAPADAGNPDFPACTRLANSIAADELANVYDTPAALDVLRARGVPRALTDATRCVARRQSLQQSDQSCFTCLFGGGADAGVGCANGLVFPPPPALDQPDVDAWKVERDVERVQAGLQRAVRAMAQTCTVLTGPDTADESPLERAWGGARESLMHYQHDRPLTVHPDDRPVNAWVLSGGAANGAFSAGAAWWLLQQREACGATCTNDHVDFVSAASTGTLIATIAKNYFRPGASQADRKTAIDDLSERYTCSANADLYCEQDVSLYDLFFNPTAPKRGLIDFVGVRNLVKSKTGDLAHGIRTAPEQFASTVDYQSGAVVHFSSSRIESQTAWWEALEGSFVEPLAAEPVSRIGLFKGTWLDGGVRSGLPISTPLRRGADRAVVFVNSPFEGIPRPRMRNVGDIVFRSIELFSLQPILGELAEAEEEKVLTRQGEKERCLDRLGFDHAADAADLERRCSIDLALPSSCEVARTTMPRWAVNTRAPKSMDVTQPPKSGLERLQSPYEGSWLFLPTDLRNSWQASLRPTPGHQSPVEWKDLNATGYTFDPNSMWNLFVVGALVANERCEEVKATLNWHLTCQSEAQVHNALSVLRKHFEAAGCGTKPSAIPRCAP